MTDHPIEPGIYDMPESQYFPFPAFSNSDLKLISRSPAHYWAAKRDPKRAPEKDTPAKAAGRAIHCAILEPSDFDNRYIMAPENAPKKPTKAQINSPNPSEIAMISMEFWTDFDEKSGGKEIITPEQYDKYMRVRDSIQSHPELKVLLKDGLAEKSVFAVDPETGLLVKCRTDYFRQFDTAAVIIDLKTSDDVRPFQFQRSAYNYGYFQQAAYYSDIWKWSGIAEIDTWLILAAERDAPYAVKLYEVANSDIEFGRKQYRQALNIAAECNATDIWPSYDSAIEPLHIPAYASLD